VHDEAFKGKIRSDEWLDVHLVAHELGPEHQRDDSLRPHRIAAERLIHMEILRAQQDVSTHALGYKHGDSRLQPSARPLRRPRRIDRSRAHADRRTAIQNSPRMVMWRAATSRRIIPLPFIPDGSGDGAPARPTGLENLRTLAIAG
jgi:hypothetical protein